MMTRPPGRRPSQVLADVRAASTDRMMAKPPGRRPSQVMVDIAPTHIRAPTHMMMAMPPGRRPSQVMVVITSTAAEEEEHGVTGNVAQGSVTLQGSSGGASKGREHRSNSPRKEEDKGKARGRVGEAGEAR